LKFWFKAFSLLHLTQIQLLSFALKGLVNIIDFLLLLGFFWNKFDSKEVNKKLIIMNDSFDLCDKYFFLYEKGNQLTRFFFYVSSNK